MRNQHFEQTLNREGVHWSYMERLELAAIDKRRSHANQARAEAVIPELVEDYRERYRQGLEAPPLIVHKGSKTGKHYAVLDGNQRREACEPDPKSKWKGILFHDAYLIEEDDEEILNRIAWSFNNEVHGRRLTYEESMGHAMTYVRKYGWDCARAARQFGVKVRELVRLVHTEKMKDKLHEQGVKRLPSDSTIEKMGCLADLGDDVFAQAAIVVAETGASQNDVENLVKVVRGAKTHAEKLTAIGEFSCSDHVQQRKAETRGGTMQPRRPLPRLRLERCLKEARTMLEDFGRVKGVLWPMQAGDKKQAISLAADVIRLLVSIYGPVVLQEAKEEAV